MIDPLWECVSCGYVVPSTIIGHPVGHNKALFTWLQAEIHRAAGHEVIAKEVPNGPKA